MRQDDPALIRDIGSRIRTNIQRMQALINDTLDFARGRLSGGIALKFVNIDDVSLKLEAVARELQDAHPTRRIESRLHASRPVEADLGRLQQLASNLLGNAIAHGASEQPVKFSAFNTEEDLVLEVWNHGPSIPEEYLPKIFAPFWRKSILDSREGLGLGLYICSEIVKAHGGTLTVSSTETEGTRFTTTIPLRRSFGG
jgi:signal transduction histidine kinase